VNLKDMEGSDEENSQDGIDIRRPADVFCAVRIHLCGNVKSKAVPPHDMKAPGGRGDIAPAHS
jgi:hypothetical protein